MVKTCKTCLETKSLSRFYYYPSKNRNSSNCKICKTAKTKEYADLRKDEIKEYKREWRRKNRASIRAYKRDWQRKRMAEDELYRLKQNVSNHVYKSLKNIEVSKSFSFWLIVGYSPNELKEHLTALLNKGMNWVNYGQWHLDHIKPVSKFDIKEFGDEEFIACWALSNLRPLWGSENRKKGAKFPEEN